jgi:BASS family bile acid:Na+ symporter
MMFETLKKILSIYTRLFAAWVILFGVLAYFFPQPLQIDKKYNLWFFALTMFGIGAVLRPTDFQEIGRRPWIVLLGTAAQFTFMPLGAFVCAKLLRLPDDLAVGLIIAGCAPGAMSSNVMSYIAKADTAYSVSLTTVSTLLCPLMTPLLTKVLAGAILPVPFWAMTRDILWMVIIPLGAGFAVRGLFPRTIERIQEIFPALSVTFIIFVCSYVIAGNRDRILQMTLTAAAGVALLNLWGLGAGYQTARLFKLSIPQRRTLSIEIGMQNAGLGTALAIEHFGPQAAIPTALFVFVCIITASILVEFWKDRPSDKILSAQS